MIKFVCEKFNLEKKFYRASDLKIEGVRSEKLINLCDFFQATKYFSPNGSSEYLEKDNFSSKTMSKLEFQKYSPEQYPQSGINHFISHLSIVDVICNLGFSGAKSYIYSKA